MRNPWEEIRLEDYENHMQLESVFQLQAMNAMMRAQFAACPAKTVMILGVAGGNGLEHLDPGAWERVYGVDINRDYLVVCGARYPGLGTVLETICADLTVQPELPHAELLIANLLVEYIGYNHFRQVVSRVEPRYISCGIQINTDDSFVSDSPYLYVFDGLEAVHHQIEEAALQTCMETIGYRMCLRAEHPLPNGKKLVRLDFVR